MGAHQLGSALTLFPLAARKGELSKGHPHGGWRGEEREGQSARDS